MSRESNRAALFARYLKLLGQAPAPPTLESLAKLVRAHIIRCPFENISKLYRVKHLGLRRLPGDLALAQWHPMAVSIGVP